MPDAIEQPPGAEGDNMVSLIVRIALNVIPEHRRAFILPQREVKVPTQRSILCDVVHHNEISQIGNSSSFLTSLNSKFGSFPRTDVWNKERQSSRINRGLSL